MTRVIFNGRKLIFREEPAASREEVNIGEVIPFEDGHYYFWPDESRSGAWSEWMLRGIADHIRPLNEEFDRGLDAYMEANPPGDANEQD